jgi:ferredoxin
MPNSPERSKQEEFVLRTIEERNIRFIRLWFTDVLGFLKSVAIAPAELENAFDEGIGFDGSAIEGFARVTESDMLARPDSATFSILPWRTEAPGAARMQQIDVERSQEFRKCIECFLCQDVCHVVRDHEENKKSFAGPRFFIRIAELDMHPLDMLKNRKQKAQEEHGLGMCNITKCCTEVCPEHIRITDNAIIPMKERVVDVKYDPVRWLGSKIRKREGIV